MSRIPQPSSRSSLKTPTTPTTPTTPSKARTRTTPTTPLRTRTQSTPRATTPSKPKPEAIPDIPTTSSATMSIKEAIALRRAEAKKAQAKTGGLYDFASLEEALPSTDQTQEEEDILGRLSVRETIEKARSTGSLNLATRSLLCLPSALFEMHLNITPDPLKSVPNEPVLPPSDLQPRRGGRRGDTPAWFEAQDLQVLKAWNNEITEIQHEISLFGSLKTVDLHKNKLTSLPDTFVDLMALTVLDLSHNSLTSLPANLFALPELTTLNISHNTLSSLPFNAPFASNESRTIRSQYSSSDFFTPAINRATTSLPRLVSLDASYNKISAAKINLSLPSSITKLDLSGNPLGPVQSLLRKLATFLRLKELRFDKADVGDESFPSDLFSSPPFPALRILDMGDTRASPEVVRLAIQSMKQELRFEFTDDELPESVTRVMVGKRVMKESWEVELERRSKARAAGSADLGTDWGLEPASISSAPSYTGRSPPVRNSAPKHRGEVVKEAWEIEAEQGLLTEGGKRRARALAAAAAADAPSRGKISGIGLGNPSTPPPSTPSPPPNTILTLSSPKYFSQTSQTLTLPPSAPLSKAPGHARAFSLAGPSASTATKSTDLTIPAPTLPLSVIVVQPFADSLRTLVLVNRRMDRSFDIPHIPDGPHGFLPNLEELDLEGCSLADLVTVVQSDGVSGTNTSARSNELLLPLIAKLFPSLRTLNLSYNVLTNSAVSADALSALILSSPTRKGLRHLRLRGNKLSEIETFQGLANMFKGNRVVPEWHMEELDLRDNEIGRLPAELGLLPLDVFLVDGNTFRVPQRRVWEREGTKGLLAWLRGRLE
ncbi:hypothetical protein BDQ17DRAFT_1272237 [Cyathus striatus]|nr:hypothetical protein BDQ17DRAFT_1272237 [Cyathus striatus]